VNELKTKKFFQTSFSEEQRTIQIESSKRSINTKDSTCERATKMVKKKLILEIVKNSP
jgi:hypothetical protein